MALPDPLSPEEFEGKWCTPSTALLSANTRPALPLTLEQRKAISVVFRQEGVMEADLLAEEGSNG